MIVKVQLPLITNEEVPLAFIYDETRNFQALVPVTSELLRIMEGSSKRFFKATLVQRNIELGKEVEDPGW
jgi:hypothetical protein